MAGEYQPDLAEFLKTHKGFKEIAPDKTVARRFNKLSGRNARVSISFNEEMLGAEILFNAEEGTLVIKDIPAALKTQLLNRNSR